MKTKDKKLTYSILAAILIIVVIILGFSTLIGKNDNQIYITLYSPIDDYKKVIKTSKGSNISDDLVAHEIEGYEFVGWFYDSDLNLKVEENISFYNSQILLLGYSKIIIKDKNGFNENLEDFQNNKYLTIRTKNSSLSQAELNEIVNLDVNYLDLSNASIGGNAIKEYCFLGNTCLKGIKLPDNIVTIDDGAFKNCYNLTYIDVGKNLKIINQEAFYNCKNIESINIENVETIQDNAFNGCENLKVITFGKNLKNLSEKSLYNSSIAQINLNTLNDNYILKNNILYTIDFKQIIYSLVDISGEVVIDNDVEIINESSFENRQNLKKVVLPLNLKVVKDKAFKNCKMLEEVTFQNNNNYELCNQVFYGCEKLGKIKFSNGLSSLGDEVFKNCYKLKSVDFNTSTNIEVNNLKSIGNSCFNNCKNLEFFVMPDSVENIGYSLFSECSNLSIVNLSSRLTNIPNKTFYNNDQLTKVVATMNIISIGDSAFEGCKRLLDINTLTNVTILGEKSFKNCQSIENIFFDKVKVISNESFYNCVNLKNISIKSVEELKQNCFYGCESLTSFNISSFVTLIEEEAFNGCISLEKFAIEDNNNFQVIDGVLYSFDISKIICYPQGKKDESFLIKENINQIDNGLYLNEYLKEILVEETNINFSSSKGILYNKDKTELYLYPKANKSTNVEINSSVKIIKSNAFINSRNIIELIIPNTVEKIEKGALKSVKNIKTLKIPFIGESRTENKFLGYIFGSNNYYTNYNYVSESLKNIVVTDDNYVSEYSFYNLNNIESISFNNKVKIIESYAFYGNNNLKEIFFEGALTKIKSKSFYNVANLRKFTFSFSENINIESNSFYGLTYSLEIVVLNDNQHVSYVNRTNLKNKFISVYKKAENWKWLF